MFREEYAFGWLLSTLNEMLFYKCRSNRQDWQRYRSQMDPRTLPLHQWNKQCHWNLSHCLHFFAAYHNASSKEKRKKVYKALHSSFVNKTRGVGNLGMNHSIFQKACLGFLPTWVRDYVFVNPKSRALSWINKKSLMLK